MATIIKMITKTIGTILPEANFHMEEIRAVAVKSLGDKLADVVVKNPDWWITLESCRFMHANGWMKITCPNLIK